ncbi:MAG: hypothetical protein ABIO86_20165 [Sphingomonas sp.]
MSALPAAALQAKPGQVKPDPAGAPQKSAEPHAQLYRQAQPRQELEDAIDSEMRAGNGAAAATHIRELLATEHTASEESLWRTFLGIACFMHGDARGADEAFAAAEKARPGDPAQLELEQKAASIGGGPIRLAVLNRIIDRHPEMVASLDPWAPGMVIAWLMQQKRDAESDALILRLAALNLGKANRPIHDELTMHAVQIRLRAGQLDESLKLVRQIHSLANLTTMLIDRRYQALWPALEAMVGPHMESAIAASIADAEATVKAAPDDGAARWSLIETYYLAGRLDDADRAGRDFAQTPETIDSIDQPGTWAINEHAMVLHAMNRRADADARLAALTAQDFGPKPWLINIAVNRLEFVVRDGAFAKALGLMDGTEKLAHDFGNTGVQQGMRRLRLCTALSLDSKADVTPLLSEIRAHEADSRSATLDALLCVGKVEEAEGVLLRWLANPDPQSSVLGFMQPDGAAAEVDPSIWDTSRARLRGRPEAQAAFLRIGRDLPVAYWPVPGVSGKHQD